MSATGRGSQRDRLDRYDTPPWVVHRLLEVLGARALRGDTGVWAEPAVGAGRIALAADEYLAGLGERRRWWLCDVAPRLGRVRIPRSTLHRGSYLAPRAARAPRVDFVITNPPYRLALDFARRATAQAPLVALFLRLNWIEGAAHAEPERYAFLRSTRPDVYVLPNRPRHTRGGRPLKRDDGTPITGSDATAYAWVVWDAERPASHRGRWDLLDVTSVEERRATP